MKTLLPLLFAICLFACDNSTNEIIIPEPEPSPTIETGKITTDIVVNGVTRDYILYLPESYTGEEAYPLLFVFHGLGGSMEMSYQNSKFYELAESEGFIVVHPDGLSNSFDAVSITDNKDIDFTVALIAELEENYNIESKQIYSTGMSNGGYFSHLLACELSDKIAAIGPVAGLMFAPVANNCEPTRPVPVLQIHGTNDMIVSYDNVEAVLTIWRDHNHTDETPIVTDIPDTNLNGGSRVERYVYANGDNGVEVQLLKVVGGRHQWPGYQGNMDINASEEVWNFVSQYDIEGKIE